MSSIENLSIIKNNLPIIYKGSDVCMAAKLLILKKNIKTKYPELKIYFVFDEKIIKYLELTNTISIQDYEKYQGNFVKECIVDSSLEDFCEKNDIDMFVCHSRINNSFQDENIIETILTKHTNDFFLKTIDNGVDSVFFGRESPEIIDAAYMGNKVVLIESGSGTVSFQKMFPDTRIISGDNR